MPRFFKAAGLTAGAMLVAACESRISSHGFVPEAEVLATVQAGVDTRGSVQRKIGRPSSTGVFTDRGWYYVSTTIKRDTYKEPEVIDRRLVAIAFDENDVVASIAEYGLEDGRTIDLQTRTTPTAGRELSFIEQALGNIGVNVEDFTE